MSAAKLREAAALMRTRAEAALPSPWEAGEACVWSGAGDESHIFVVVSDGQAGDGGVSTEEGAEHIASWHPAVALAVADWLDTVARLMDHGDPGGPLLQECAVAAAAAYLGDAS